MKRLITICLVVGLMVFTTSVAHAVLPSDNFDDDSMNASLWNLYEDDHSEAWLDETNHRLEMCSTGAAGGFSAIYAANGWGLLPTDDFSLKVDFHYSSIGPKSSDASVYLGLGGDWDDYLAIEAGCSVDKKYKAYPYFYYEVTDDFEVDEGGEKARSTDDGTLYISYDAAVDELYLSDAGYGAAKAWVTIPGLLQGEWGGDIVSPFLAGWSRKVALCSGKAWLDNFVVESGTIPEPATMVLLAVGGLAVLRRRRG